MTQEEVDRELALIKRQYQDDRVIGLDKVIALSFEVGMKYMEAQYQDPISVKIEEMIIETLAQSDVPNA
jgi:hypothetical protein